MSTDVVAEIRDRWADYPMVGTHSPGCHQYHAICAIRVLLDAIDEHRRGGAMALVLPGTLPGTSSGRAS